MIAIKAAPCQFPREDYSERVKACVVYGEFKSLMELTSKSHLNESNRIQFRPKILPFLTAQGCRCVLTLQFDGLCSLNIAEMRVGLRLIDAVYEAHLIIYFSKRLIDLLEEIWLHACTLLPLVTSVNDKHGRHGQFGIHMMDFLQTAMTVVDGGWP